MIGAVMMSSWNASGKTKSEQFIWEHLTTDYTCRDSSHNCNMSQPIQKIDYEVFFISEKTSLSSSSFFAYI